MALDRFEQSIKDSLRMETDDAARMQDEIWQAIKQRIETEPEASGAMPADIAPASTGKPMIRLSKRVWAASIAAAVLAAVLLSPIEPVQAFVSQVREWFVPQKKVQEQLEGMPYESDVSLQDSGKGYVIYFDPERYRMTSASGVDRIDLADPPGGIYPEVYMEIARLSAAPAEAAKAAAAELQADGYSVVREAWAVTDPLTAVEVYAVGGTGGLEWNDPVTRYYYIDDRQGGSFAVKQHYYLEAEEGHGDRFKQMLKEFHIVVDNDEQ